MYRNLKFLHMTDFFSTDTVRVSVTNMRYEPTYTIALSEHGTLVFVELDANKSSRATTQLSVLCLPQVKKFLWLQQTCNVLLWENNWTMAYYADIMYQYRTCVTGWNQTVSFKWILKCFSLRLRVSFAIWFQGRMSTGWSIGKQFDRT